MTDSKNEAHRTSSSFDLSDTDGPLLDEFPVKADIPHPYGRGTFWTRVAILKWPLLISSYTMIILVLQHAFYFSSSPGFIAGRDVNGLVPECKTTSKPASI